MFLKTSISTTKKLFQKTLDSVKYLFSGGYQKIPKIPAPCSPLFPCAGGADDTNVSQRYRELDKFYIGFSTHCDKHKKKIMAKEDQKIVRLSPRKGSYHVLEKQGEDYQVLGSNDDLKRKEIMYEGKKKYQHFSSSRDSHLREERSYLVAQKLKELKMLDKTTYNEEHALDIEEVVYYYSRLTCPAYLQIVDNFFMEMYSELFNQQASSFGYINHPNMGLPRVNLYY
ncbi:hypothetical protein K7X08_032583 [Anisodus acutangulus]|uniref:Uncharacterized protein n=1 Tax=Anisodus acutangulus TaxID=402998 RepID=A0A9Q1MVE5_9SOLA|nr:hypothetical protein K7X08_032583 [Anisodus acutangulus]